MMHEQFIQTDVLINALTTLYTHFLVMKAYFKPKANKCGTQMDLAVIR